MPTQTSTARTSSSTRASGRQRAKPQDAIQLLRADHRKVQDLFDQFEKARGDDRKAELAQEICTEL